MLRINPPGNPKANYRVNNDNPADAQDWLDGATVQAGTWWNDYTSWLQGRCGGVKPAPSQLGGAAHPQLAPAPGTYGLQS